MRRFINVFIILGIWMISSVCFAGYQDVYFNGDKNYIQVGGSGTNNTNYIDRSSLNVHKYAPPYYIIAINNIPYVQGVPGMEDHFLWKRMTTYRYMYDYNTHKMYVELFDKNKQPYWQYLDANFYNKKRYKSVKLFTTPSATDVYFARGEIAFALAYNMSFYKNGPLSWYAKNYFETLK